ncbi:hypothetical protein, partial [Pseudomonas syringae group genomosp. 7]|uniref:hypothetical protein n=1 Tax=Pseudomonas syringae group genomosp. 7 TaxID=251699 RepID=UPI00376F621B
PTPFPGVDGGQLRYRLERCDDFGIQQPEAAQVCGLLIVLVVGGGVVGVVGCCVGVSDVFGGFGVFLLVLVLVVVLGGVGFVGFFLGLGWWLCLFWLCF